MATIKKKQPFDSKWQPDLKENLHFYKVTRFTASQLEW